MTTHYNKLPGDEPFEMENLENLNEKTEIKVLSKFVMSFFHFLILKFDIYYFLAASF